MDYKDDKFQNPLSLPQSASINTNKLTTPIYKEQNLLNENVVNAFTSVSVIISSGIVSDTKIFTRTLVFTSVLTDFKTAGSNPNPPSEIIANISKYGEGSILYLAT